MQGVGVRITKYVDPHQPGWVECSFTDASGREWRFVEKVSVVSSAALDGSSAYPQPGVIACEVIASTVDKTGRAISEIDTARPWGVESTEGVTRFVVLSEQLTNLDSVV